LPVGPFKARDGSPFDMANGYWQPYGLIASALIARVKALGQDILTDYYHHSFTTDQSGKKASIAGCYNSDEIEWREFLDTNLTKLSPALGT